MENLKKLLTLLGFLFGLAYGARPVLIAYQEAAGPPGVFELAVQVLIVGLFGGLGAVLGLGIGTALQRFRKGDHS